MTRLPLLGRAVLFGLALLAPVATVRAADTPTEEKLAALVRDLGSADFDTREQASQALAGLGRKAVKALETGTRSDDREVARRCAELLERANRSDLAVALDAFLESGDQKLLLKVPAWARFQKVVGNGEAARNLFVAMCSSDGPLLDALEHDLDAASRLFNERCQQINPQLGRPVGAPQLTQGEFAALLYAASEPRVRIDQNLRYAVYNFVHQAEPQQWVRSDAVVRKLLVGYIQARNDAAMVSIHLNLVRNLDLVECRDWVVELVEGKGQTPHVRALALGALGKWGKDSLPLIERFLKDTSQVGTITFGGTPQLTIRTQLRDVALAMAVVATGQDLGPYEFAYLKKLAGNGGANVRLQQIATGSPTLLGFASDAERDAALKRYNDWKQAQKK